MPLEDLVFQGVLRTAEAVLYLSLFGMGILCSLAKSTRYRGMLAGAFGCLGLMLLSGATFLVDMPRAALAIHSTIGPYLVGAREHSEWALVRLDRWHGVEVARYLFTACLVLGLAGRFKLERNPATDEIDRMMGEAI